jgi:quercetin dioxygenase-like cupin family protein
MCPEPYILQPGSDLTDEGVGVKASGQSTDGAISLVDSTATGGAPLHTHRDEDECFFVIEGAISVRCGDNRWEVAAGGFVFLPRGVPHAWDVIGGQARLLIITTPGGFEQFLREFHAAQPDEQERISERYGITFLPDPEW